MLTATAHAKLNLFLHIAGKRSDGYHLLDSLVAFCRFGDRISVSANESLSLKVSGPFASQISAGDDNLVLRAARLVQDYANIRNGATITLDKQLPVGAGLGGGSSDAAAAVHMLCALWGVALPPPRAANLLLPLGADLPVCLRARPAYMSGIGEVIEPLTAKLPVCHVLLVKPPLSLLTRDVYAAYVPQQRDRQRPVLNLANAGTFIESLAGAHNDLQRPAVSLCADVMQVLLELQTQIGCGLARVSGSGSACFGLFENHDHCVRAAERIAFDHPRWWVRATELYAPVS